MSGTALGFEAVRMNRGQYADVVNYAKRYVSSVLPGEREIRDILAYTTKESFGDADILVQCTPEEWDTLVAHVKITYEHWNRNGDVISFGYIVHGGFHQVDLINGGPTPDEYWCAFDYFAWNDLGNLIGRIADRLGFKYGHDGLRYQIRDPLNSSIVISDFVLSLNTTWIHTFLGIEQSLNFSHRSFDTREDIFEYVATSKYFDPDIFLLENRNYKAKVRDAKRTTYMEFLEWCKVREFPNVMKFDVRDMFRLRAYKLGEALKHGGLETMIRYHEVQQEYQARVFAKCVLNGTLVTEWTGQTGVELGQTMQTLRKELSDEDVINLGPDVKETVLAIVERTKRNG